MNLLTDATVTRFTILSRLFNNFTASFYQIAKMLSNTPIGLGCARCGHICGSSCLFSRVNDKETAAGLLTHIRPMDRVRDVVLPPSTDCVAPTLGSRGPKPLYRFTGRCASCVPA